MLGDDASVMTEFNNTAASEDEDARMLNAIFSASVVLQDAYVSNGILSGE